MGMTNRQKIQTYVKADSGNKVLSKTVINVILSLLVLCNLHSTSTEIIQLLLISNILTCTLQFLRKLKEGSSA